MADFKPTNSEIAILRVLWQRGPSTVRDVHSALSHERDMGYTTVLKLMQIMAEKGLVVRDDRERAHVYAAAQAQAKAQDSLVSDLANKVFGGSAMKLAMHALNQQPCSPEELKEIRRMLDELEAKK
ncbi:MAG: BlaI/MecI/CopY family transcriptional regulator [Armatimonadetes bacterium]|nr:BlaI/MecI/CopY family transcriptional regulator [Armatimonadota bacterium]